MERKWNPRMYHQGLWRELFEAGCGYFLSAGDEMPGKPGEAGASRLLSILELCQPQRLFRNCCIYEERATVRDLRSWNRRAWQRGQGDYRWDGGFLSGYGVHPQFPVWASQTGIPHGMGKGFPGLPFEASGEKACDLLWRHECGTSGNWPEEP